ncbi:MAG: apolipoprotein N-acyltransferase [Hyphomicrobiales bacterium]|nr:apolipoprotein N-acyltransferase [Hyphomicrobiales bacterium]
MAADGRQRIASAAIAVGGLGGWRRLLLAIAAGALSVLAMAPFHAWPVLLVTLPLLVWQLDGCCGKPSASLRRRLLGAALIGWGFGFGYFLAGLYWIGAAFLVEADRFAWLLPAAVSLLPAGLALFFALGTTVAALLWGRGPARIVGLAIGLALGEWLRGHILTGFPWNALGYALTAGDAMMQWASVFGIYGLTLIAVATLASPAALFCAPAARAGRRSLRLGFPAVMLALLAGAWAFGQARLHGVQPAEVAGVRLRIVQPNIPQAEKWQPENRNWIFRRYLDVSRGSGDAGQDLAGVTHLIWPESALPFLLADSREALAAIARLLPAGTALMTGAARAEAAPDRTRVYNSLFVMDAEAEIRATYDKIRLVPFGEYLPLQATLEAIGLEQLTRQRGGFSVGARPRLLDAPGLPPFAPLICYEIIFPHGIRQPGTAPRWLLNLTNDAWFGTSTGPYQHLHQARVRAVEQGLPVVRAANTGISAVIDPYGRILARLPLNRMGALDSPLPRPMGATPFVRWGRAVEIALLLFAAGLCLSLHRYGAFRTR